MQWIQQYTLFLFDLDGLLVNTEVIQYAAYQKMCADRGVDLGWDFAHYCQIAHLDALGIRENICADHPELLAQVTGWSVLYEEKKKALMQLLNEKKIELMPGVEKLLKALQEANIKRCVVTHSLSEAVSRIRDQNPILDSIPVWITREQYSMPKPSPDGYLTAIAQLATDADRIVGFEDTPRGLKALLETRAQPILISQTDYPETPALIKRGAKHFRSFEEVV